MTESNRRFGAALATVMVLIALAALAAVLAGCADNTAADGRGIASAPHYVRPGGG
jgi:predicted small secreted protein